MADDARETAPPPAAVPAQDSPNLGAPAASYNVLAIVSLVSALAGLFIVPFIGSVVAVITGHMSLNQLKSRPEQGRSLAVAGIIIGYVSVGLELLAVLIGIVAMSLFIPLLFTLAR